MKSLLNSFNADINEQVKNVFKAKLRNIWLFIALDAENLLSKMHIFTKSTHKIKFLIIDSIDEKNADVILLDQFQ